MKRFDCVILVKSYQKLECKTQGIIVFSYNEDTYEVEWFDCAGNTLALTTVNSEYIKKYVDTKE